MNRYSVSIELDSADTLTDLTSLFAEALSELRVTMLSIERVGGES